MTNLDDLLQAIKTLEENLKAQITAVRTEIGMVKAEVITVKTELGTKIDKLKDDILEGLADDAEIYAH